MRFRSVPRWLVLSLLPIVALITIMITPHRPILTHSHSGYHFAPGLVHAQYTTGSQWQTNDNVASLDLGAIAGCSGFLTTGAFAANPANAGALSAPSPARTAANNYLYQVTTTAAASALTLDCDIGAPFTRTTPGKGIIVTGAAIEYGVQTTALSSVTLPVLSTVSYPAYGAAAAGTVASAGGTITTNPAIGSSQLATTTSGQCYNMQVLLATPVPLNLQNQRLVLETVFNQTTASAAVYQICGVQVFYQNVVF